MTMDWISQHIYFYVVNLQLYNYHYHFVGNCGAFCALKSILPAEINQTTLLSISQFFFSMPSKVTLIVIEFMFLGKKKNVLGPTPA